MQCLTTRSFICRLVFRAAPLLGLLALVSAGSAQGLDKGGRPGTLQWVQKDVLVGPGSAFLGIQTLAITPELRKHFGAPEDAGVLVAKVLPGSAAEKVGVEVGDLLVSVAGQPVARPMQIVRHVASREKGDVIQLEVLRDGHRVALSATLEERSEEAFEELAPGVHFFSAGDFEELDPEAFEGLGKRFDLYLDSPHWQESLGRLHERRGELEKRIEELEKRLRDLDRRLEKLGSDAEKL